MKNFQMKTLSNEKKSFVKFLTNVKSFIKVCEKILNQKKLKK